MVTFPGRCVVLAWILLASSTLPVAAACGDDGLQGGVDGVAVVLEGEELPSEDQVRELFDDDDLSADVGPPRGEVWGRTFSQPTLAADVESVLGVRTSECFEATRRGAAAVEASGGRCWLVVSYAVDRRCWDLRVTSTPYGFPFRVLVGVATKRDLREEDPRQGEAWNVERDLPPGWVRVEMHQLDPGPSVTRPLFTSERFTEARLRHGGDGDLDAEAIARLMLEQHQECLVAQACEGALADVDLGQPKDAKFPDGLGMVEDVDEFWRERAVEALKPTLPVEAVTFEIWKEE